MRHTRKIFDASAVSLAFSILLFPALFPQVSTASTVNVAEVTENCDFLSIYDPGIPQLVSREWAFPTGFSLGISGGHLFRTGTETDLADGSTPKMNLFPLSFLMKYSLYKTKMISQSVGIGVGPYFLHQGPMPIQFGDLSVTGSSTYLSEWVSCLSKNLYLKLKMTYTHAFQSVTDQIPLRDFTTWLGLNLRW